MKNWTQDQWTKELARLDYTPDPAFGGWRHNGVAFKTADAWSRVEQVDRAAPTDRLRGQLGQPGLWKWTGPGVTPRRVFELPTALLHDTAEDDFTADEPRPLLGDILTWAQATSDGRAPEGWQPPARATVEGWMRKGGLTVQAGSIVRQGELIHTADCVALRMPVLPVLPPELPENNARFLHQILLEANDQWRLVRVGLLAEAGAQAVMAEVNFTGAPPAVIERLLSASLASLHWATLWLAESAELLADVTVTPRALALRHVGQSVN